MLNFKRQNQAKSRRNDSDKACIECGGTLTHPDAYFCEDCATYFYNDERGDVE